MVLVNNNTVLRFDTRRFISFKTKRYEATSVILVVLRIVVRSKNLILKETNVGVLNILLNVCVKIVLLLPVPVPRRMD